MRILLIKTGSRAYALNALTDLAGRFPEAAITVLTEPRELETFEGDRRVAEIWLCVNPWGFPGLLFKTWRRGFDLKVLLFSREASYERLKALALLLPSRRSQAIRSTGESLIWDSGSWRAVLSIVRQILIDASAPARGQVRPPALPSPWQALGRLAVPALGALVFPFTVLYLALYAFWTLRRFPRGKEGLS